MAKARAVVQVGDKKFEMQKFDVPRIGPDDALMRVEACGICGSDVDQYDGKLNGLLSLPMIPRTDKHETTTYGRAVPNKCDRLKAYGKGRAVFSVSRSSLSS